jgi:hypothetical protein
MVLAFLAPALLAYAAAVALVRVRCQALLRGFSGILIVMVAGTKEQNKENVSSGFSNGIKEARSKTQIKDV